MRTIGRVSFWYIFLAMIIEFPVEAGTLSGKISYPSDYIPNDMTVCAEKIDGTTVKCVNSKNIYKMKLSTGSYRVYAKTADDKGYKAYYTESVICGRGMGGMANCKSHKPVTLKITDDSHLVNINPQDWYNR